MSVQLFLEVFICFALNIIEQKHLRTKREKETSRQSDNNLVQIFYYLSSYVSSSFKDFRAFLTRLK